MTMGDPLAQLSYSQANAQALRWRRQREEQLAGYNSGMANLAALMLRPVADDSTKRRQQLLLLNQQRKNQR